MDQCSAPSIGTVSSGPERRAGLAPDRPGLGRREALGKIAAGSAVAWAAPMLLSSRVSAVEIGQNGCTLQCLPIDEDAVRANSAVVSCTGSGANRTVTNDFQIVERTFFVCPCGGIATRTTTASSSGGSATTIGNDTVRVTSVGSRFATVDITITGSCTDRSDDPCSSPCTTTLEVEVTFQNNGKCTGVQVTARGSSTAPADRGSARTTTERSHLTAAPAFGSVFAGSGSEHPRSCGGQRRGAGPVVVSSRLQDSVCIERIQAIVAANPSSSDTGAMSAKSRRRRDPSAWE